MFGDLARDRGNLAEAKDLYLDALRLFERAGDRRREASMLYNLGHLAGLAGDLSEGRAPGRRGSGDLPRARRHPGRGDLLGPRRRPGRPGRTVAEAYDLHHNALDLLREPGRDAATRLGDRRSEAEALHQLADLTNQDGDPAAP